MEDSLQRGARKAIVSGGGRRLLSRMGNPSRTTTARASARDPIDRSHRRPDAPSPPPAAIGTTRRIRGGATILPIDVAH